MHVIFKYLINFFLYAWGRGMKIFLKIIMFFILFVFMNTNANALYDIDFSNYSSKKIEYTFINTINSFKGDELLSLETANGKRIRIGESITIESKYKIKFVEDITPCSWVSILGRMKTHGWGIKLFVNDVEKGTICANGTNVFDDYVHARLVYNVDPAGKTFLQFYNTGWWENQSVFPVKIDFWLN